MIALFIPNQKKSYVKMVMNAVRTYSVFMFAWDNWLK